MVCLLEYRRRIAGPSGNGSSVEPIPDESGWKYSTGLANRIRSAASATIRNIRASVKGSDGSQNCRDSRFVQTPIRARRLR